MPIYTFRDNNTGNEFTEMMSMKELDEYLSKNPNFEQLIKSVNIVDPYSVGRVKVPSNFNNLLKKIKKANSKGSRYVYGRFSNTFTISFLNFFK